ncbi:helix-turn-helix transcriptional regulator [bacterium]|nr:helix-turn-helix transcriptional regulator [bacterium]
MIKLNLREIMWARNVSGVQLHEATGVSQAKISEMIRGKRTNVTLDTIERICLFLDCTIDELVEIRK